MKKIDFGIMFQIKNMKRNIKQIENCDATIIKLFKRTESTIFPQLTMHDCESENITSIKKRIPKPQVELRIINNPISRIS